MPTITAGEWRGKSGAIYNVFDDLYDNPSWPFHDDAPRQKDKRFWKKDGTAWTGYAGGGDDLVEPVASAPAIATPTIEAGKFYRTRDGRKVGPMRDDWPHDRTFRYHATAGILTGHLWDCAGIGYGNQNPATNLVAEWIDEPKKGNLAAQVDNLADEYGGGDKPKFKVGDRVRAIADAPKGFDGAIHRAGETYLVAFDTWRGGHEGDGDFTDNRGWWMTDNELERLLPVPVAHTTPAIVALITNGQPRPSPNPFVHAGRTAAEKEAKRLAGKHAGKEFGVYELVSTVTEEPPAKVYAHEWQRLAAAGFKIDAIRVLREQAGTTLRGTKQAVEDWLSASRG